MRINVKINNWGKISKVLNQSPVIMAKYLNSAIKQSIHDIEREAKPKTPVAKPWTWKHPRKGYVGGRLRGSYNTIFAPLRGTLYPSVDYAIYVHEGTRYMRARPFLKQGVEAAEPTIQRRFENALSGALNEIALRAR